MFDFVSTREDTSVDTRLEARLLAALIASQLLDAARPTTQAERRDERNLVKEASEAILYLFDSDSPFERHIELIGGDADTFRAALLGSHELPSKGFTDAKRRVVQLRHHWWLNN